MAASAIIFSTNIPYSEWFFPSSESGNEGGKMFPFEAIPLDLTPSPNYYFHDGVYKKLLKVRERTRGKERIAIILREMPQGAINFILSNLDNPQSVVVITSLEIMIDGWYSGFEGPWLDGSCPSTDSLCKTMEGESPPHSIIPRNFSQNKSAYVQPIIDKIHNRYIVVPSAFKTSNSFFSHYASVLEETYIKGANFETRDHTLRVPALGRQNSMFGRREVSVKVREKRLQKRKEELNNREEDEGSEFINWFSCIDLAKGTDNSHKVFKMESLDMLLFFTLTEIIKRCKTLLHTQQS